MRIGGEAPGRRAHTRMRPASHILGRVTATSDHPRQPASVTSTGAENHRRYHLVARCSRHRTENDAFRRLTARYQAPKGDRAVVGDIVRIDLREMVRHHRCDRRAAFRIPDQLMPADAYAEIAQRAENGWPKRVVDCSRVELPQSPGLRFFETPLCR